MQEIWETIIGYESYKISNFGRVRSLFAGNVRTLNPTKDKDGYLTIGLRSGINRKTCKIHRLVAIAFINNPDNKPQVNHIDGDKLNNAKYNLEWNTISENTQHSFDIGLNHRGEKHARAKVNEIQVLEIRASKLSHRKLSGIYKISYGTIGQIKRKEIWKHI